MSLNAKQNKALDFVNRGHNLLILGSAGTGKSFLVDSIAKLCIQRHKTVSVTSTTGIACNVYQPRLNPMTIHKWSGIGDGRYGPSEIKHIISNNTKFTDVVNRVKNTDVLIVDEVSMMSKRFFESLHEVCSLKDESLFFGGIQVILVGDFLQLAPVPCARYNEDGSFCFESKFFDQAFPHVTVLTEVVRQTDMDMIKAIREISVGVVSDETTKLLNELKRPLQEESIKLFSTNDLVDDFNRDRILNFPGQLHESISIDTGDKKYLKELTAPRNLWLKIGIPVILIKNLSDQLVNGLRGTVFDIQEDGKVLVEFTNMKDATYLEKVRFEVFDPRKNAVVAVREQYPLKPAFALTIHKSQGMTMERVEVDCRDIFKPGQLGVAIGRACTLQGLRVINFTSKACIQQPEKVLRFVNAKDSLEMEQDRSCCNAHVRIHTSASGVFNTSQMTEIDRLQNVEIDVEATIDELDDEFNQVIADIEDVESENITLPDDINLKSIIKKIRCEIVVTPIQYETNSILSRMDLSKLEHFAKVEYKKLSSLFEECPSHETGQISSKVLGDFYAKVHQHSLSLDFKMNCFNLFENESAYGVAHQHICFNISMELRKYILSEKAKKIQTTARQISHRTITHASRARVRYVGGYCIAKVRHKYVTKKSSVRYSSKKSDIEIYEDAKSALKILNSLKQEEQNILASTVEPDSLLDISRRQNMNRGLTNISDNLFQFFIKLTDECLTLFSGENLNKIGSDIFSKCQNEILSAVPLYEEFVKICCTEIEKDDHSSESDADVADLLSDMTSQVIQIENIYRLIITFFLLVMLNQFRKDVLESYKVEKKMAHSKQIRVASHDKGETSGKQVSSTKRKSKTTQKTLCAEQDTSDVLSSNLPSTSGVQSDSLSEPEPGPSTSCESESKTLDVSEQQSESDLEVICKVCDTHDKGTEWIQCDGCDSWLHRYCAGLKHHMKWKKYQKKGSRFLCKECE